MNPNTLKNKWRLIGEFECDNLNDETEVKVSIYIHTSFYTILYFKMLCEFDEG